MNHINRLLVVIAFASIGCGISAGAQKSETSIVTTESDGLRPDVERKTVIKSSGSGTCINGGFSWGCPDNGGIAAYGPGGYGPGGYQHDFSVPHDVTTPVFEVVPAPGYVAVGGGNGDEAARIAALEEKNAKNDRNIKRLAAAAKAQAEKDNK